MNCCKKPCRSSGYSKCISFPQIDPRIMCWRFSACKTLQRTTEINQSKIIKCKQHGRLLFSSSSIGKCKTVVSRMGYTESNSRREIWIAEYEEMLLKTLHPKSWRIKLKNWWSKWHCCYLLQKARCFGGQGTL